jgi:hypothetical protein
MVDHNEATSKYMSLAIATRPEFAAVTCVPNAAL